MSSQIRFTGDRPYEEIEFTEYDSEICVVIANRCCGCCGNGVFNLTPADVINLKDWLNGQRD